MSFICRAQYDCTFSITCVFYECYHWVQGVPVPDMAQLPDPTAPQSATAATAAALAAASATPPGAAAAPAGPAASQAAATFAPGGATYAPGGATFAPGTPVPSAQYWAPGAAMPSPQSRMPNAAGGGGSMPALVPAGYPYAVGTTFPRWAGPRPSPLVDPWRGGVGVGMVPVQQLRPGNGQFVQVPVQPAQAVGAVAGQQYPLPQQVPGAVAVGATYSTLQGIARSRPKPGGVGGAVAPAIPASAAPPASGGSSAQLAAAQQQLVAQQQLAASAPETHARAPAAQAQPQQQDINVAIAGASQSGTMGANPFESPVAWAESTQEQAGAGVGAAKLDAAANESAAAQEAGDLMGLQEPPRPSMLQRLLQSMPQACPAVGYPQQPASYPNVPPPFPFNNVAPMQQQKQSSVLVQSVAAGHANAAIPKDPALQQQQKSRELLPDDDLLIDADSDSERKTRVTAIIGMYEYGQRPGPDAVGAGSVLQRFSSDGRLMNRAPFSIDAAGAARPPLPPLRPSSSPDYQVGPGSGLGPRPGPDPLASKEQQQRSHRRIVSDSSTVRQQLALPPSALDSENALETIPSDSQSPPKSARREASFPGGAGQSSRPPQQPPQLMPRPGARAGARVGAGVGSRPTGAGAGARSEDSVSSVSPVRQRTSSAAAAMRNPIPLDLMPPDRTRFGGSLEHHDNLAAPATPPATAPPSKSTARNSMGDDQFGIEFDRIRIGDAAVSRPAPSNQFKSTGEDTFDSSSGAILVNVSYCILNVLRIKIFV